MDAHETATPVWTPGKPSATASNAVDEEVVVVESHVTGLADSEAGQPEAAPAAADAPADTGLHAAPAREWSEIKAMFVDDPGESVRVASDLVGRAIENLVSSLRQRQESLSSLESGDASDTEALRNVLRSYQNLFDQLDAMSGQFAAQQR